MAKTDPRIDAYIGKSADFARPILNHLRELVHKACPDAEETIKWGMPYFDYQGSILCGFAAFKQHCAFIFWKGSIMRDPEGILHLMDKAAMGHLDKITSIKDLPPAKTLIAYIKRAAELNEENIKLPPRKKVAKKELKTPEELAAALKRNKKAKAVFEGFSSSHKNEYIEWITEAKTEATREKRIDTAIEWMTEGKARNWKYMKK